MTTRSETGRSIYDTMVQFFRDDDWNFTELEEGAILQLGYRGKNGSWPCFAHYMEEFQRFRFVSIMASHIPTERSATRPPLIWRMAS